jgi:hypothetical protein
MLQSQFDPTYVGFTTDGAQYLAEYTNVKLVRLVVCLLV